MLAVNFCRSDVFLTTHSTFWAGGHNSILPGDRLIENGRMDRWSDNSCTVTLKVSALTCCQAADRLRINTNHLQLLDKTEATMLFHSNSTKMLPTYLRHTGTKDEGSCPLLGNSKHPLAKEEKCASCRTIPPRVRTLKKYILLKIL